MTALLVRRGAWMVAALFLLAYGTIFLAIYLWLAVHGIEHAFQLAWWQLRVPGLDQSFGDLRTVTHVVECLRHGIDPYVVNPCDPWWRLVNYPPVWLRAFDLLGVGPGLTPWLGAAIDIAFVATALVFVGRRPVWQGVIYGAALISPALMMGIERGNNDYLVFALVVVGLLLMLGDTAVRRAGATLALIAAVVLKLFPVFSIAMVLIRRRSLLLPALLIAVVGAVYFLAIRDTLDAIARNTHREVYYSYGAEVFFIGLQKYFGVAGAPAWKLPALLAATAAGLLLGALTRRSFALPDNRWGAGFAIAAAIYLFSFAIASSFDYRQAFLLLGLPQLMDWAADPKGGTAQRLMTHTCLATILLSLWLGFYTVKLRLIDEAFNWVTFVLLLAIILPQAARFLRYLRATLLLKTERIGSPSTLT